MKSVPMTQVTGLSNGVWNTKVLSVPAATRAVLVYCSSSHGSVRATGSVFAQEDNLYSPFRMLQVNASLQADFWSDKNYYLIAVGQSEVTENSTYDTITVPGTGGWQTIDISSLVPAGTTLVELHYQNWPDAKKVGARAVGNGNDLSYTKAASFTWEVLFCPVDASRQIQLYKDSAVNPVVYKLFAYTSSTATIAPNNRFDYNTAGARKSFPAAQILVYTGDMINQGASEWVARDDDDDAGIAAYTPLPNTHGFVGFNSAGLAVWNCPVVKQPYFVASWNLSAIPLKVRLTS